MTPLTAILDEETASIVPGLMARGFAFVEEALSDIRLQKQQERFLNREQTENLEYLEALLVRKQEYKNQDALAASTPKGKSATANTPPPELPEPNTEGFPIGLLPTAVPTREFALPFVPFPDLSQGDSAFDFFDPATAPPRQVDLSKHFPPVRDQRARNTCVAFASLGLLEYFRPATATDQGLSEQFLYWTCKQFDGIPQSGTHIENGFAALYHYGSCREATWEYNPQISTQPTDAQGPPPSVAIVEASQFRSPQPVAISATDVATLRLAIAQRRPVAVSICIHASWWPTSANPNPPNVMTGRIPMPWFGEAAIGSHALCLVGYVDGPLPDLSQGFFIVRNSFGKRWGVQSPYGEGYGTIPYAFLQMYGILNAYTF